MLLYSTNGDIPFFLFKMLAKVVMDTFDIYDKKRISSIYYNITPILSSNYLASKIAKAFDFTTL